MSKTVKLHYMRLLIAALIAVLCSTSRAEQNDPIKENFGPRPSPYPGFLAINEIPQGFAERRHFYSRRQYEVELTRTTERGVANLHILESDITIFLEPKDRSPKKQFAFQGQPGRVFCRAKGPKDIYDSCTLYWFNGPKQRLSIYLEDPMLDERSPDYLIEILENMKIVP